MDDRRFDALTRSLAMTGSRRWLLGLALSATGVAAGNAVRSSSDAQAARRPTPTQAPIHCPNGWMWNGNTCVCIAGEPCGPDCCTAGGECCDNACCYGRCLAEEQCCIPQCDVRACGNDDGCDGVCDCPPGLLRIAGFCGTTCTSSIDCLCGVDCYSTPGGSVCGAPAIPTGPCTTDQECATLGPGVFCNGEICVMACQF